MEKVIIKEIFPIREQNAIIVHLNSFGWEFKEFGLVYLSFDNQKIKMRYVASGNHEGNPALTLELCDSRFSSINEIMNDITNKNTIYYIERKYLEGEEKG